jgi:hypothetical protein
MIDHLSGNHREFFDPDKAHKAICDTSTMEARVTDSLRLLLALKSCTVTRPERP